MKFTKKLVTVAAALCAVSALFLTGCGTKEDELGIFSGVGSKRTIDFTNDPNETGVNYARAFVTTATKHLSADILVEIDSNETTPPKYGASYTVGYLFDLDGSGKTEEPYSFGIVGLRYNYGNNSKLEYYISYFTNVLSSDITSNKGNFVTADNSAVEYDLSDGWQELGKDYYAIEDGIVTVFIKSDAVDDNKEPVTKDATGYSIVFSPSKTSTSKYTVDKVVSLENLNAAKKAYKTDGVASANANIKLLSEDDEGVANYGRFAVKEAKLGCYAMVGKEVHLVCTLTIDDTVKNASTGDAIIWNEETITNVR